MRGIVLAGGTGSRLGDTTKVVNKHLLPVGGRPMIHWPLKVLRDNNIDDITIVSSPRGIGQLAELLGGGYTYRVQDRPGGIAQALACAQDRSSAPVVVILGDNVFLPSPNMVEDFPIPRCYLSQSPRHDLKQFGVPRFNNGTIADVVEKPTDPGSSYAVTGLYTFGSSVFDKAVAMAIGHRGEYEITDLLNQYARGGALKHTILKGFWGDAGTVEGMAECSKAISEWGE